MYYVIIGLPIIFVIVTLLSFLHYCKQNKNNESKMTTEEVWLESLDLTKWRGGVRRRMDLVKTKEDFYKIKDNIRFP